MVDLDAVGLRSYVSEPRRGKRRWRGDRQGQEAVYANRRRIRGERGQRRLRGIVTLIVLGRKGLHGFPFRRPHSHFPIH